MSPGTAAGAGDARGHQHVRTSCGRELTIGWLALGDKTHPAGRVFVDLGDCQDCHGSWASFTIDEAQLLARALLVQIAAARREDCTPFG